MPTYRVTIRTTEVHIVDAENPFMAAAAVSARNGDGVEITDVRPATGRPPAATKTTVRNAAKKRSAKKTTKAAAKKRRPLSPEARAKLAQNLVKARAARAKKAKAAKKKTATRKTAKKATRRS